MTPHLSVPSTSHQCSAARSTTSPAVASYAPTSSSTEPNPPTRGSAPNRQARTQSHPRSSSGSPRWASSQSSTARRPSGPTTRLPLRKSPWTSVSRPPTAAGRWRSSQRKPSSNAGCGSPVASRVARSWASWSPPARPGTASSGMRWMRASASPHWAASRGRAAENSSSRRILRAIVSPGTRSTTIHAAPNPAPAGSPGPAPSMASDRAAPVATTPGTGTPSAAAARSSAASVAMPAVAGPPGRARCRISGRPPASNAHVSRDAPPDSRRSPVIAPASVPSAPASALARSAADAAPRRLRHSIGTSGRPSSSSWCRYSLMP